MMYFLIVCDVFLLSVGQLLFKKAAIFSNTHQELSQIGKIVTDPWFYLAGACFITATLVYMKILATMELSEAYPITTTLAYILTILGSLYFFNEKLSTINIIGITIILFGILLASYSK